jgi:type IV fimbrial biogenesis protein FimT
MPSRIRRGFTLIELMTALAIFGLLIMLAGPQLATFLANSQVRNMAEAVLNGVQRAQTTAISTNAPARLVLDPTVGTGGWEIQIAVDGAVPAPDPATPCGTKSGANPVNPVQLFCFKEGAQYAKVTANPGGATAITFDGFGRLQCNTDDTLACDGSANLQWVDVTNPSNASSRPLRVCITDQQAPGAGSIPVAASQIKMCDPAAAATEPQACPANCS